MVFQVLNVQPKWTPWAVPAGKSQGLMPRVPQHLPRSRNVPPRALEPSWKDLYSPKSPGKETWFPSRPPAQTLKTHWVRRASRLSNPKFPELGSKASSGCERWPVPPDRALLFPPRPLQCPVSPPRMSGPCPSLPTWPSSPGRSPHAAPSMASSKAIASSSGHSTLMAVSLLGM